MRGDCAVGWSATVVSCDDDPAIPYPACHVHRRDWDVPVRPAARGAERLPLVFAEPDAQTP